MRVDEDLIATDIDAYLDALQHKSLLRFITCGSVDDGKSTLIGRLLFETKLIFDDQMAKLEADSKKHGTQGGEVDFALLVDGLAAEREQGITIDVAYRFFSTERRKFIVADTPGHEQYTRNMATGASTANLAVLMIDARKGVLTQTRRHSFIVNMIGVKHLVLAINKMDLVGYSEEVYRRILDEYKSFAADLGIAEERIVLDPGIGFGKSVADNLALLNALPLFHALGSPLLLGVSRKRMIGALSREEAAHERLGGSIALAVKGMEAGVHILRVHDVAQTVQARNVWRGLRDAALTDFSQLLPG